jgi:RecA-family ATPase
VARIRTDYLHKTQKALETSIDHNEQIISNSSNQKEKTQTNKDNTKLKKQLEETRKYDEALSHIANRQIDLDLDYGVKVNYEKFQNVKVGSKKIN